MLEWADFCAHASQKEADHCSVSLLPHHCGNGATLSIAEAQFDDQLNDQANVHKNVQE